MRYLIRLLFLILAVSGCRASKNATLPYQSLGLTVAKSKRIVSKKFNEVTVLYYNNLVSHAGLQVDSLDVLNWLDDIIEVEGKSKIFVIDWEGEMSKVLRYEDRNSKHYLKMFSLLEDLLFLIKNNCNDIEVGFYGYPFRIFENSGPEWIDRQRDFVEILKHVDIIFPSVYDRVPDNISIRQPQKDYDYVKSNVEFALKMGYELDKKVMPFVWHRYSRKNRDYHLGLIPKDEFRRNIDAVYAAEYKGKYVDNIVWWGPDELFYKRGKLKLENTVMSNKKLFNKYFETIINDYSDILKEVEAVHVESRRQRNM